MFCYSTNDAMLRTTANAKPFDVTRCDANKCARTHLQNYFYLKFLLLKSDNANEKIQASKELKICERKLAFWQRQATFNSKQYELDVAKYKKQFAM